MSNAPLSVVTVQVGRRYPDLWVTRLAAMVARQLQEDHRFIVYTENSRRNRFFAPDSGPQQFEVRDLKGVALQGFFAKLRLFDQELTGTDPFLFLDSTLVIRASLAALAHHARRSKASLIGVRDWNYPILNSSVLWIRPDAHTQVVWEAWRKGYYKNMVFHSDQNFIFHVFRAAAPEALSYWPQGLVSSYKCLRKMAKRNPDSAQRALEASCILKFHGRPKPDGVLCPWRHPRNTILRYPLTPRLWNFLADEIRAHWC
jgi:hypothetical protein